MKKREMITTAALASLAAAAVLTAGVGSAHAYFTTYAEARGGYTVELGDRTEIWEGFSEWTKKIVITSTEDSEPVWIRVKAFAGNEYTLLYQYGGDPVPVYASGDTVPEETVWYALEDGYYYYNSILDQDTLMTKELDIKIEGVSIKPEEGSNIEYAPEDFNVIVIYESTPVRYDKDGREYADWSQILDSNLNNPEKDPVISGGADERNQDAENEDDSENGGNPDNDGEGGEG